MSTHIEYGHCIYCGQTYQLETSGDCTEERLNQWATDKCDCHEAKKAKEVEEIEKKAKKNIERLFSENYPDAAEIMKQAVYPVMNGLLAGITIDTGRGIKGKITLTSKGKVKIEQVITRKTSLEE